MNAQQTRYESAVQECRFRRLSQSPELQAEVIANHYTGLAITALQLKDALKNRREGLHHGLPTEHIDQLIEMLVNEFKAHHMAAFGIALEWPEQEQT